jgi:uncharacterized protein YdeI (YjbR/CyaY-like superfamily)
LDRWRVLVDLCNLKGRAVKADESLHVVSRSDFRKWLAANHPTKTQIWLILYKKSSGKQTFSPGEALEEAICYGWIDTRTRSIDEHRFAMRFNPRHKGSRWSDYNKAVALRMLRAGKVTEAGKAVLPAELLGIRK